MSSSANASPRSKTLSIGIGAVRVRLFRPTSLDVTIGPVLVRSIVFCEGSPPVDIALGDNQFSTIHVQGVDAAGLPGTFKSPPGWSVDHPEIVLITPSADGLTCRIEAASPVQLGTAVVTATDTDDPTIPALTFNVTIGAEAITQFVATVDPPTEKTTPTPTA